MIGVVLAGGRGRRMGAGKAALAIAGRPLISYPVDALQPVCERVVVVCKRDTELPPLDGAERWDEPDEPRHPLAGIVFALERAGGPVLVCAADMPLVTRDACTQVGAALRPGASAAVAVAAGRLQPLLAAYAPEAGEHLRAAGPDEPLTATVERLAPVLVDVAPEAVFNVNTPADAAEAERRLST